MREKKGKKERKRRRGEKGKRDLTKLFLKKKEGGGDLLCEGVK